MKPAYKNTTTNDVAAVRRDLVDLAQQFGESAGSKLLGEIAIGTTETVVAHGMGFAPRWREYSRQGPGFVYQTKPPGKVFLYLIADTAVTVGIEVF
jgi:hypothetical protein